MKCPHCCMNATDKGEDMTWETFKTAVDCGDECITLGGGEPTLHPNFEQFLFYALAHAEYIWMATNGSQIDRSIVLANLAKKGILGVALSQDKWHDPIDHKVVDAFQNKIGNTENDRREIRNVGNSLKGVINTGRATKKSFKHLKYNGCACEGDVVIDPNGNARQCGCIDSPIIGNVFDGYTPLDDEWQCWKIAQKELAIV